KRPGRVELRRYGRPSDRHLVAVCKRSSSDRYEILAVEWAGYRLDRQRLGRLRRRACRRRGSVGGVRKTGTPQRRGAAFTLNLDLDVPGLVPWRLRLNDAAA